jgi:hypothetical protein
MKDCDAGESFSIIILRACTSEVYDLNAVMIREVTNSYR